MFHCVHTHTVISQCVHALLRYTRLRWKLHHGIQHPCFCNLYAAIGIHWMGYFSYFHIKVYQNTISHRTFETFLISAVDYMAFGCVFLFKSHAIRCLIFDSNEKLNSYRCILVSNLVMFASLFSFVGKTKTRISVCIRMEFEAVVNIYKPNGYYYRIITTKTQNSVHVCVCVYGIWFLVMF